MPVKIFISYSHDEYDYMNKLRKRLTDIKDRKTDIYTDEQIIPGQEWDKEIRTGLQQANIILFLVSKKFIVSRYIKEVELQNAIERKNQGEVELIPILLENLDEEDRKVFPLAKFEPLPVVSKKQKPLKDWSEENEAYDNIISGIQRTVDDVLLSKQYNAAIIKKFKDHYKKANYDSIFKELQKMETFLERLDPIIFNSYLRLAPGWHTNKTNLIRKTRNAEQEKDYLLNDLLDFIGLLESKMDED